MAEALGLGAALCSAGMADGLLAMTSSHFCAAERQFRTPLSYGAVRTPTAQWTATAAGACLLRPAGEGVQLCAATFGRVQDYKIKDINNMGAAMAPAAAATLLRYLKDTGSAPADFDRIYTGDLGHVGSQLLRDLLAAERTSAQEPCGLRLHPLRCRRADCEERRSGPGCCASVLCGHILPRLEKGTQKRVLFIATGALMSQTTFFAEGEHPGHRPPRGAAQPAAEGGKRMNYFWAFVVGGGICVIGQLLIDLTGLTPARILTGYVVAGVVLSAIGWYAPLAEFAGCGATVPLLGFGHLLAKGVRTALEEEGAVGILTGGLTAAAAGITTSLCAAWCAPGWQEPRPELKKRLDRTARRVYAEDTDQRSVKEDEQMPRNKYPEQTVEKILDAAAALFAEKATRAHLQDIIDATGLSKGAVYHHSAPRRRSPGRWVTAWGMRCGSRCATSGKQRV